MPQTSNRIRRLIKQTKSKKSADGVEAYFPQILSFVDVVEIIWIKFFNISEIQAQSAVEFFFYRV